MRADQYARLQALADKLIDVALDESDPETWSGHGKRMSDLTRDERGDRYWCKRNAAATMALTMKVYSLTGHIERNGGTLPPDAPPDPEADLRDELEAEISAAEREAAALIERVQKRSRERRQ